MNTIARDTGSGANTFLYNVKRSRYILEAPGNQLNQKACAISNWIPMTQDNSIQNQITFVVNQNISTKGLKKKWKFCVLERKTPLFFLSSKTNWICHPEASSLDSALLTPYLGACHDAHEELWSCNTQGCKTSSFLPFPSVTISTSICTMLLRPLL